MEINDNSLIEHNFIPHIPQAQISSSTSIFLNFLQMNDILTLAASQNNLQHESG